MELSSIAKPYAQAIFTIASTNNTIDDWSAMLKASAYLMADVSVKSLLLSPKINTDSKVKTIIALLNSSLDNNISLEQERLIAILINNNRILTMTGIYDLFVIKQDSVGGNKLLEVFTPYDLTPEQTTQLQDKLSTSYKSVVSLKTTIAKGLLGGAVIKNGDRVIDNSIAAKLAKLSTLLPIN